MTALQPTCELESKWISEPTCQSANETMVPMAPGIRIRKAVPADVPVLRALIDASVRGLQAQDYTPAQIDRALESVFGVDSQLVADGTYFVAEAEPDARELPRAARPD